MNKEKSTLGTETWKEIHSNSYKEIKLSLAQELTEEERTEQTKAFKTLQKSFPDFEERFHYTPRPCTSSDRPAA